MPKKTRDDGRAARRARAFMPTLLAALALSALLGAPGATFAQSADAGVQVTPDAERVLVSKDVNGERWAITRNDDGTVTGNVFPLDGGPPAFVWCEQIGGDDGFFDDFIDFLDDLIGGGDGGNDEDLTYACFGADPCDDSPCTVDEWDFIADVTLPESFFRP